MSISICISDSAGSSIRISAITSISLNIGNIGRAAVGQEFANVLYLGLAKCSGDRNQKRAPTLMRTLAMILPFSRWSRNMLT